MRGARTKRSSKKRQTGSLRAARLPPPRPRTKRSSKKRQTEKHQRFCLRGNAPRTKRSSKKRQTDGRLGNQCRARLSHKALFQKTSDGIEDQLAAEAAALAQSALPKNVRRHNPHQHPDRRRALAQSALPKNVRRKKRKEIELWLATSHKALFQKTSDGLNVFSRPPAVGSHKALFQKTSDGTVTAT